MEGLEGVRIRYDEHHRKLRIICGSGGPHDPEVVISCEEDKTILSVFNPLLHDPRAPGLTGWRGVVLEPKLATNSWEGMCGSLRRTRLGLAVCKRKDPHPNQRHHADIRGRGDSYHEFWWDDEDEIGRLDLDGLIRRSR